MEKRNKQQQIDLKEAIKRIKNVSNVLEKTYCLPYRTMCSGEFLFKVYLN